MKSGAPTMKDVAKEAGVALGTVSKVFNGIPVGDRYKKKVEEAAERLGYQVNQYARGLKTNKTFVMGVILPTVSHPFYSVLLEHVCNALNQRGYRMQLYLTNLDPKQEKECLRLVKQHKVDGVIAMLYFTDIPEDYGIPVVTVDRKQGAKIPCVSSDNYGGGRMQAEKLLSLGCRNLAFLRTGSLDFGEVDKRGDGFESACRGLDVSFHLCWLNAFDKKCIIRFREFFEKRMKNGKLEIDGIGCSTDQVAWQAQTALRQMGIRVPEDVQIVGYDGVQRFGTEELSCSTVVQPVQQMAETCVDLLLNEERSNVPALVCLPVTYSAGGTTKEPLDPDLPLQITDKGIYYRKWN